MSPSLHSTLSISNDVCAQQPFHCEIEHKLGMTCLTTGPVTCRVRLDRGGYVPGEAINIWATIDNQSKVTVKGTRSCLTEVKSDRWAGVFIILPALLDHPVHHQEQGDGDGEQGAGRHQPRQDQGGLHWWLEVWATVRAAPPPHQPQRLPSHPHTIRRLCKSALSPVHVKPLLTPIVNVMHCLRVITSLFQFIVTPCNFEKPIKLQLPILLATYPLRNEDGTMRRKNKTEYPTTLPIFRPWLDEKNLWQSKQGEDQDSDPGDNWQRQEDLYQTKDSHYWNL